MDLNKDLSRCLKDCGCDAPTAEAVSRDFFSGNTEEAIRLLRRHRGLLMDALHESQARVDCLDFLVLQMKKQDQ